MIARATSLRLGAAVMLAAAALAFGGRPASAGAEPYLGWDFGGGVGIGIGAPPSAYDACPTYGWPVYPYRCRYAFHRATYHSRWSRRHRRYHYYH